MRRNASSYKIHQIPYDRARHNSLIINQINIYFYNIDGLNINNLIMRYIQKNQASRIHTHLIYNTIARYILSDQPNSIGCFKKSKRKISRLSVSSDKPNFLRNLERLV